jgi:hypothetical protein
MLTAIRQWVVRTMMKAKGETGIVKTLPKKDIVEINTQITAERLMQNGIDPRSLKNPDQVENAIIAIENRPNVQQGITSTKSADVFDLKGKKIKDTKNIMGGEELPPGDPDLPPPGSRGGPDDIAAPVQSAEETMKNMIESELMKSENPFSDLVKTTKQKPKTIKEREKEILASMEKSNKETVARIKNRKIVKDAIDNASPGFVKGDRKYNAQLVADDLAEKKFGKEFSDLDQRQQMDLYGEALDGLDDLDKFAQGGRIGYKIGSIDKARRAFLKAAAGVTGGIAALKTGLLNIGKGTTKQVAKEIITTPKAPGKPEWFDALVTKVVNEGTDVTKGFATKERQLVHTKQINDFAEVTVYRDLDTNTTTVNYGTKLRKDPTKPYERGNIQRAVNDPDQIDLVVKGAEDVEPTIIENERGFVRRRGTKSSAEFEAYESEPRVVNYDGDMEFDGTNVVNNVDDLNEDVSVLKEYATGKKLTPEEAAKAKKKQEDYQKFLEDPVEQANYLESKYGPGPEPDDFASGGIARMLGE